MPDIRPMKAEDWEQIHEMDLEIFPDDPIEEDWFRKRVEREGCFVLDQDDQIIGNLIVSRFGVDAAHLGRIGIAKSKQGKGYGSMLMAYAIEWFQKKGEIREVHLYTQDFNETAQNLYKKYGFRRVGTTWHYFVPYDSTEPRNKYTCQEIQESEIELVGQKFTSLPTEQIRRFLTYEEFRVLTLKDNEGNIEGACRFTPSFPGCFPFEVTSVECFDDFMVGLLDFKLPEHDYCRVTFTDIPELVELCEKRNYRLHHRLHKMALTID